MEICLQTVCIQEADIQEVKSLCFCCGISFLFLATNKQVIQKVQTLATECMAAVSLRRKGGSNNPVHSGCPSQFRINLV